MIRDRVPGVDKERKMADSITYIERLAALVHLLDLQGHTTVRGSHIIDLATEVLIDGKKDFAQDFDGVIGKNHKEAIEYLEKLAIAYLEAENNNTGQT